MRSTGEVLGLAETVGEAFYKAQEGAGGSLPLSGNVFISVNHNDRKETVPIAQTFVDAGFTLYATRGTCRTLDEAGIPAYYAKKLHEGRPNILDEITNGKIQLIYNTPEGKSIEGEDDSYIRKAAIKNRIPYQTTPSAAAAAASGLKEVLSKGASEVKSLQERHREIQK